MTKLESAKKIKKNDYNCNDIICKDCFFISDICYMENNENVKEFIDAYIAEEETK